jgi:hypothetical protein
MDELKFWLMKSFAEVLVSVGVIMAVVILAELPGWIKQSLCPHKSVRENGRCDAICVDCGKNLGFIGAYRRSKHQ